MDIPTPEQLVKHYEDFCSRFGIAETRFGRDATGEPQLIASIRAGRSPSLKVLNRVKVFMAEHEARATASIESSSANKAGENICAETIGLGDEAEWPVRPAA